MASRTRTTRSTSGLRHHRRRTRRFLAGAVVLLAGPALAACRPAPPHNSATDRPTGSAYSVRVAVKGPGGLSVGVSGLAGQGLPCNAQSDAASTATMTSSLVPTNVPLAPESLAQSGSGVNTGKAVFDHAKGSTDVYESSTINGVNLLGGVITADSVVSRVHTTRKGGVVDQHLTDGSTGATFTNLRIAGVPYSATPPPNTGITLPLGLGSVILNARGTKGAFFNEPAATSVDGIQVNLVNLAGLGGTITIAHAQAGVGPASGRLIANGFLANVSAKPLVALGPVGVAGACGTTNGKDVTTEVAGVTVPVVGSVGAGRVTINGNQTSTVGTAKATATTGAINLLGGLITADALVAKATSVADAKGARSNSTGTQFTNLSIAGTPVAAVVPPNTKIDLPGIGSVTLNETGCTSDRTGARTSCTADHRTQVQVTSLRIRITVGNTLGLPIGADLVINRALAGAAN